MVNDLEGLLRRNVASPPPDHLDIDEIVSAGRGRVRRRRVAAGAAALATAAVVTVAAVGLPTGADQADVAGSPPQPAAPTISLTDARTAVEGRDYEVLASHTNTNLHRENGQYLDGVTDDGQILVQDGPRDANGWNAGYALLDPVTEEKDVLPDPHVGQDNVRPVDLGADQLVLVSDNGNGRRLSAVVFDRETREWTTTSWPTLPRGAEVDSARSHDGRLYVRVPATQGQIPEGGWPTQADGDAEDADAEGDTYHLWSVSPTDGADVRDEQMVVGDLTFTDSSMVWTDRSNGDPGMVHVRDLASGEEHSFDPQTGERCNLLGFGATDDRVVMSQYCGTYDNNVRDDRVQILSTDGDQVVTLQDSGVGGWLPPDSDLVAVTAILNNDEAGNYVYDLATNAFLRITDEVSNYAVGHASGDQFMWGTPANHRNGATQWLGELL